MADQQSRPMSDKDLVEILECYQNLLLKALDVVGAWTDFKNHHDVEDMKIRCCEKSGRLFDVCEVLRLESAQAYKLSLNQKGLVWRKQRDS